MASTFGGTQLNAGQIKQLAINAGFKGQSANTITAIALSESRGWTGAVFDEPKGGQSFGLTQIYNKAHAGASDALDPQTALNKAYTISSGGTNFSPWSTYNNGAYLSNLSSASSAIASAGGGSTSTNQFSAAGTQGTVFQLDDNGNPIDPQNTAMAQNPGVGASGEYGVGQSGADTSGGNIAPTDTTVDPNKMSGAELIGKAIGGALSGSGNAASGGAFWNWFSGQSQDLFIRIAVFILGAIMLGAAAWAFAKEPGRA